MTEPHGEWTFPASHAQERVWVANQFDVDSPVYNVSSPWRITGLSREQITDILQQLVSRHEALRTHLRVDDGALTQVVRAPAPFELPVVDLRDLAAEEQPARINAVAEEFASLPIPLDQSPLWRAQLIRIGEADWWLVFVAHHAVYDSRSVVVFWDELGKLAEAALAGDAADLPELPIQYPDYAVWQREQLTGAELELQLSWWRERLAGAAPVINLPTDRPRPPELGFAGDEVHFDLPAGLLDRVAELGRSRSATPYMVLLSAFAALLSRLSGTDDLVVGVSTAGRDRPELESLIGMFVNPVALRCDVAGDPTFAELLGRTRTALVDAMDHGQTPFQLVVEAVVPQRDPSVQPIFQVSFNYIPDSGFDQIVQGTTKDDLSFDITAGTSRLLYRTTLFDRSTAEAVVARYVRLLEAAVADPQLRVSELPLLDSAERDLVVRAWNDTMHSVEQSTLPVLIERQAASAPDTSAVVCDGTTVTYRQLNARANQLARQLIARGAGPESLVALALPRSVDLVVAVLAVLKSGAAYVPIDTGYPAERIKFLLDDAAPALVLASPQTAALVPADALVIDGSFDGPDTDVTDADRVAPLRPEHPAYVIYTSGSTGRPKGVVVEHRSVNAYLAWARHTYPGLTATVLLPSPVSFDLTVTGLLGTLTAGGTIRLAAIDEAAARTGGQPSFLKATPSHLSLLDGELSPTGDLVLGGEALTREPLAAWRAANPGTTVINEYGPTEATVGCVAAVIRPGESLPPGPVSIGRPVWNTQAYLLDANLQPVPPGVVGQLYIAGDQVARGYLRRPALTAERFLPCPFGPPGRRMYATGDLARWRTDGTIDYLGRSDHQVKIRGMRVELGEIESTLLAQPQVRDAVVVVRGDGPDDQQLVAYVVGEAQEKELADALARTLPAHMVPAAFVELAELPLTPNGKLDRDALPAPQTTVEDFVPPRTDAETLVAEVFAELLQVDKVGAFDDFFAIGGNSLRGMRAMARIRAEIDVDLPMRTLFAHPVVADLAAEIERLIAAEVDNLSDDEVAALLAAGEERNA